MNKTIAINEWENFCKYLIQKNRYILSPRWGKYVTYILEGAQKREKLYPKKTKLWRARIGSEVKENKYDFQFEPLKNKEICAPPPNKAREGRANPRGISYLYLSCDEDTAISEIRPYLNKQVTIATFKLVEDVLLVDASTDPSLFNVVEIIGREKKLSPENREKLTWAYINSDFSIPIAPEDNHCDYVPTQYLSELFKNKGYDGVIYRSSLNKKGCNVVLFDDKVAVIESKKVARIRKILYEYR